MTIEEKANEYAKDYLFRQLPQRAPNFHFEAGANAVLEEIENIVTNNEDNTLCMARCLVDKIKELKGE